MPKLAPSCRDRRHRVRRRRPRGHRVVGRREVHAERRPRADGRVGRGRTGPGLIDGPDRLGPNGSAQAVSRAAINSAIPARAKATIQPALLMLVMLRVVQIRWTRTWAERGGRARPVAVAPDDQAGASYSLVR